MARRRDQREMWSGTSVEERQIFCVDSGGDEWRTWCANGAEKNGIVFLQ